MPLKVRGCHPAPSPAADFVCGTARMAPPEDSHQVRRVFQCIIRILSHHAGGQTLRIHHHHFFIPVGSYSRRLFLVSEQWNVDCCSVVECSTQVPVFIMWLPGHPRHNLQRRDGRWTRCTPALVPRSEQRRGRSVAGWVQRGEDAAGPARTQHVTTTTAAEQQLHLARGARDDAAAGSYPLPYTCADRAWLSNRT